VSIAVCFTLADLQLGLTLFLGSELPRPRLFQLFDVLEESDVSFWPGYPSYFGYLGYQLFWTFAGTSVRDSSGAPNRNSACRTPGHWLAMHRFAAGGALLSGPMAIQGSAEL
jgi:hypothetical protein